MRQDQQATVGNLQRQLNEALARVDRLSADLAKERSLHDVPPVPHSPHCQICQVAPMPSVPPPQLARGDEIMADTTRPQRSCAQSRHSDHPRHHRLESRSPRGSRRSRSPGAHPRAVPSRAGSVHWEAIYFGVFNVPIKPRDPPTFLGRTQDNPEVWVGRVSNFFRLVGGPPQK